MVSSSRKDCSRVCANAFVLKAKLAGLIGRAKSWVNPILISLRLSGGELVKALLHNSSSGAIAESFRALRVAAQVGNSGERQ